LISQIALAAGNVRRTIRKGLTGNSQAVSFGTERFSVRIRSPLRVVG